MRHKHLNYATRHIPGYNAPTTTAKPGKKRGAPHQQPFHRPATKKQ